MKIMPLFRNGWVTCILSAHGALSNVTLRQGGSSTDTAIYQVWSIFLAWNALEINIFS
jgi:hypothetical protein